MGVEAIVVVAVVAVILGLLIFTRLPADAVMVGGLTLLLTIPVKGAEGWRLGVVATDRAFSGFANEGLLTVAVLFVVVTGLRTTGAVDWIGQRMLGQPQGLRAALTRIVLPVAGMSAFLNNTPIVAMLIPVISDWSRRIKLPASKLLMPLSYAAIIGGTCSLIGTSTNLVVSGMVSAQTDLPAIGVFDVTWVGLPCAILGALFLIFVGPKLLPDRASAEQSLSDARQFTSEMMVPVGSPIAGQTVQAAGMRNLPGCYLVEIDRDGEIIPAVGPDVTLKENDRLVFAGVVDSIRELQNLRGLAPATDQIFKLDAPRRKRQLFEAVVSRSCVAIGKTIKEARFRTAYGAAVLAVARAGQRLTGRIGDIRLRVGDVLLLEAAETFERFQRDTDDFLLIRALEDSAPRRHERASIAIVILVAMVLCAALGWLSMLLAAMLASGLMLMTRCCSISDARRSVDWPVLIVIGAALGVGEALSSSGAASALAATLLSVAGDHPWLVLAAIYLSTSFLTEIVTNNAAVAIAFPIALAASERLGVNFQPFVFTIMMAGSASFATPLGYQTNLMVFGPGGYRFTDFLRMGVAMNLLMGIPTVLLSPLIWPF